MKDEGFLEYRPNLPDDCSIRFAHGDLHRSNILIKRTPGGLPEIAGIVDWEMSGWYPAYWDYCKARGCLKQDEIAEFGGYLDSIYGAKYANIFGYWQIFVYNIII